MPEATGLTPQTKAVLFDHDGTLIDSETIHFRLWSHVLAEEGVELSYDFYCQIMAGIPAPQNARDVVKQFSLKTKPEKLTEHKYRLTRQFLRDQAFPLMPYAKETITRCYEAGFKLGIVTGGTRISVERTLDTYGMRDMISSTVTVEDVEHSKPAPDCYRKALHELSVEAGESMAVEDTEHGLHSAVAAGLRCVVIPTALSQHHEFSTATSCYSSLEAWLDKELTKGKRV